MCLEDDHILAGVGAPPETAKSRHAGKAVVASVSASIIGFVRCWTFFCQYAFADASFGVVIGLIQ
jgi:hypothetical protein